MKICVTHDVIISNLVGLLIILTMPAYVIIAMRENLYKWLCDNSVTLLLKSIKFCFARKRRCKRSMDAQNFVLKIRKRLREIGEKPWGYFLPHFIHFAIVWQSDKTCLGLQEHSIIRTNRMKSECTYTVLRVDSGICAVVCRATAIAVGPATADKNSNSSYSSGHHHCQVLTR